MSQLLQIYTESHVKLNLKVDFCINHRSPIKFSESVAMPRYLDMSYSSSESEDDMANFTLYLTEQFTNMLLASTQTPESSDEESQVGEVEPGVVSSDETSDQNGEVQDPRKPEKESQSGLKRSRDEPQSQEGSSPKKFKSGNDPEPKEYQGLKRKISQDQIVAGRDHKKMKTD